MNWLFRNRHTGEITVAQAPNISLGVWIAAAAANLLFDPSGWIGTALRIVATAALLVWGADELLRGVNPFRRALGAIVLTWIIVGLASR